MRFWESEILGWLDARAGDGIEALVKLKHRLRLQRLHHSEALDPGLGRPEDGGADGWWAAGEPPPRAGCSLEVFVDGADYFAAVAEAIGQARESIHIAGWHVAPHFQLARGRDPLVLGGALAEAAERLDVRVLVWAGSPLPVFRPSRSDVSETVRCLTRSTGIRCEPDPREHPFHCHHEKIVVIDSKLAFVGGIDMTDLAGDRYDVSSHPARREIGWHDVSTRLRGPVVADVGAHFNLRWRALTGEDLGRPPVPEAEGPHTVQLVRTVAEGMYDELPRGDFRILESYLRAIDQAEDYIYLENQFLWSPEIVSRLADKLRRPPNPDFRLVIVLPARANNGQDDTSGQVAVLESADDGAGRMLVATLRSLTGTRDDRLYVHAKVGIVDDRWLTVGSANLNAHSLLNDTEMNVVSNDTALARDTRLRLWSEHLQLERAAVEGLAPHEAVDRHWRPIAMEQLQRRNSGQPPTHRLIALPGVSRRSRRLLGPLTGLIDDG